MTDKRSVDGPGSVYFDATEHSSLIDGRTIVDLVDERERSPWASATLSPRASAAAEPSSTILPPVAQGYLTFGTVGTPSVPLSETETTTFLDDESLATSALESSYAGHLRAQSTLPRKWLNDVDIEPYMRVPGAAGKGAARGRKENIFASRSNYLREPLLEELLPTSRKETLFPAIHGPVTPRDQIVAYLYWASLTLMMIIGVGLLFVYPAELRDRVIRSSSMFRAIVDSSWVLLGAIALGSVISFVWTLLLRWFPTEIINMMVYFVPVATLIAGLWATFEFLHADSGGGFWLLLGSVAGLATSALFVTFIMANRKAIKNTIEIVKMSSEVLAMNPGIYAASLLLLLGYSIFVVLWLTFYVHALMLGHVETLPSDALAKVWRLNAFSYYIQAYLLFMLIWTSIIISCAQKCMIGGVVGRWYFFRTDSEEMMNQGGTGSVALAQLKASFTTFFGQLCLASLVLSLVKITRGLAQLYYYIAQKLENGIFSSMIKSLNLFFGFVERLFEHITDLSIFFVALTGENFWSSGRAIFKIFRRNMLLGFTTDMLSQLLFTISTTTVAALTGLSTFIFIAHGLKSEYGFAGALLFSLLMWYMLRFFTGVFSDTMDASFVCFAIDLDTEKLHSPTVHQAFSHRVTLEADF